jgi:uncharacterized membrane protein YheB (UPF0754 family)
MGFGTITGFMDDLVARLSDMAFLGYLAIPLISAAIGWGTNWLAAQMIFWPVEFRGFRPLYLGWQGIVPKRIHIMAAKSCDLITEKLLSVDEVFGRVDPARVAEELRTVIRELTPRLTHEIMNETAPLIWNRLPSAFKEPIHEKIIADSPRVIERITQDMKDNIHKIFDLKQVVVDALVRDKVVMNDVIIGCARPELRFLVKTGLYLGFIAGFGQLLVWHTWQRWWFLPIFGAVVGYITNWVALKLVFEPKQPRRFLGITFHGLFLKRQQEVAEAYAAQVQTGVLNPTNILEGLLRGPSSTELFKIIHHRLSEVIDESTGVAKPLVEVAIGTEELERLKKRVVDRLIEEFPQYAHVLESYTLETLDIENTLRTKMQALDPEDFVGVIRPAFEQDEWMLVVGGGILGAAVGFLQVAVFFGF